MFNKKNFDKEYKSIDKINKDYDSVTEVSKHNINKINANSEIGELPLEPVEENIKLTPKTFQGEPPMNNKSDSPYRPEIPRKIVDIPNTPRIPSDQNNSEHNQRLVIGKTITIKGDISSCDTLVIEGKVEANVFEVKNIEIAEGGVFKGKAEVENASIAGSFEGTLVTQNNLDISNRGKVKGNIKYENISIAIGGLILGDVDTIGGIKK